jgi:hypothetical protein
MLGFYLVISIVLLWVEGVCVFSMLGVGWRAWESRALYLWGLICRCTLSICVELHVLLSVLCMLYLHGQGCKCEPGKYRNFTELEHTALLTPRKITLLFQHPYSLPIITLAHICITRPRNPQIDCGPKK